MPLDSNQPLNILDIETSGLSRSGSRGLTSVADFLTASADPASFPRSGFAQIHARSQLLQIYASGLPFYQPKPVWNGIQQADTYAHTYIRPAAGYRTSAGMVPFEFSDFTRRTGGLDRARRFGQLSEEQATRAFYRSVEKQIKRNQAVHLGGWNVLYDLSGLETATHRYDSLKNYRGFFAREAGAGRLNITSLEDPFLELARRFGQENPGFAEKYLRMRPNGAVAQSVEDLRKVPGWSVANLSRVLYRQSHLHQAVADVSEEAQLYHSFSEALSNVKAGMGFDEAVQGSVIHDNRTARQLFESLYDSKFIHGLEEETAAGAQLRRAVGEVSSLPFSRKPLYALGAIAAGAIAAGLAYGKRKDRQTQITGLDHKGVASLSRHAVTDFGSGWRGQEDSSTLPWLAGLTAAGGGVYGYRRILRTPGGPEKLHRWATIFGDRSPLHIGRTFGLDAIASSYLPRELNFEASQLFYDGRLTNAGDHLQRVLGKPLESGKDYIFRRAPGDEASPYLTLEGSGERVRFATEGRVSRASFRLDRELGLDATAQTPVPAQGPWGRRAQEWLESRRETQSLRGYRGGAKATIAGGEAVFQPLYRAGASQKTRVMALDMAERMQKLLGDLGLGLPRGTWNKAFHVPFVGSGGFINELMAKRVLPAYLGYQALKYVDEKLDHKPRDFVASLPLRANLLRAELTDNIPGARPATDWYTQHVPGRVKGPMALAAGGLFAAGLIHYTQVLGGSVPNELRKVKFRGLAGKAAAIGGLLMLPFVPGMLGSRKTARELRDIYSGDQPIPVRTGRWWEVGANPLEGSKIKYFRPHWYARMRSGAADASLYGSEEEGRKANPLLHPFHYLRNPYELESEHYWDRPYPIASPALSDVPLIGPILAATVGRVIKRPVRMHSDEWSGDDYQLFGPKAEPRGPGALAPEKPVEEFTAGQVFNRQLEIAEEYTGLTGFIAKSIRGKFQDGTAKKPVYFQGSREMTSLARQYYEKEFGGAPFFSPEGTQYGYTEPLRRFVQREPPALNANEIPNKFADVSWLPGEDYMFNVKTGDPYSKVQEGYMRLPGKGYEQLHPEVAGVDPQDYPDIEKFRILADVFPYHSRFFQFSSIVGKAAADDPAKRIEYEKILARVEQVKESSLRVDQRRFSEPVEQIEGTIESASASGVRLKEYPGQRFRFSSAGMSGSDLAAVLLGEQNRMTAEQQGREVADRQRRIADFLGDSLAPGTSVRLTLPKGASEHSTDAAAVIETGGRNINRALINQGLALEKMRSAGPEAQAMTGMLGNLLGRYAEAVSFTGDQSALNPLRYIPTPYHSKLWQERTALEQYRNQEVYGSRQRRWDKPGDFLGPYFRGAAYRLTGRTVEGGTVAEDRDLNTLEDQLAYLRALSNEAVHPERRGRYALAAKRTNIGADLANTTSTGAGHTLPRRERYYFEHFVEETDPDKRAEILETASPELARALSAQWVGKDLRIRQARGQAVPDVINQGRVVTDEGLNEYSRADTALDYGNFIRSEEIAEFFHRRRLHLPQTGDAILADQIDYEDVKLKIIQNEGWDYHDFNIFNDRASMLWRKPYLDGAVRELTSGEDESVESLRRTVERMMLAAGAQGQVRGSSTAAPAASSSISISIEERPDARVLEDVRRNPGEYDD